MNKFTVPKPCHENWEDMLPEDKGRFCTACKTKVYDFTKSSDLEIQKIYDLENGNICGKFGSSQVLHFTKFQNAVLRIERFTQNNFSKFGILVSAVSLLMGISGCTKKIGSSSQLESKKQDFPTISKDETDTSFELGEPMSVRKDSAQIPTKNITDSYPKEKIAIQPVDPIKLSDIKPIQPVRYPVTMGVPIYVKDTAKSKTINTESFPLGKIAPIVEPKPSQKKPEKIQTNLEVKDIEDVRVVGMIKYKD